MVQRSMTPGGDKNGADITMALDALEMAFTHDHINAFVIVGGDSDFISLVEKLKQYGRKVIVVGGRQFTSATMQKNCHEFIAYENLVGTRPRPAGKGAKATAGSTPVTEALPLIRRALKVLSDREATPQLGLLKSTLLQLDSTFSEREYGANSFRDFMEKVAESGAVTLRELGRNVLVEVKDEAGPERSEAPSETPAVPEPESDEETLPPSPMTMQDGIRAVQGAFSGRTPPRFPLYVRQAKQFLRTAIDGFDEKNYGFASVVDLLRAAGKEGVLRIERDRQGAIRIFAGPKLTAPPAPQVEIEPVAELPIVEAVPVVETVDADEMEVAEPVSENVADPTVAPVEEPAPARRRKSAKPKAKTAAGKARRGSARSRKTVRTKSVAADRSE
jgi:hypothetical protein